MRAEDVKNIITTGLREAEADVEDTRGTGDHFSAVVVWHGFDGLSLIEQHRKVYEALGKHMTREIHALQLKTMTPSQAAEEN